MAPFSLSRPSSSTRVRGALPGSPRVSTRRRTADTAATRRRGASSLAVMEFRRIDGLPPYAFTTIDGLKLEARPAGRDVVHHRLRHPALPSPPTAVAQPAA